MTHNTREGIEETRQKLNKVYLRLAYGKSDIETAKKEVDEILHQELQKAYERGVEDQLDRESQNMDAVIAGMLQKAREEERDKNRIGQVKDVKDQVRRKEEHGKAMYEKGKREARKSEIDKILSFIERRFEDREMTMIIRKELYQSELDQPPKKSGHHCPYWNDDCPKCKKI